MFLIGIIMIVMIWSFFKDAKKYLGEKMEYREEKEQEVVDIMMALFDEDYIWECYMKDVERKIEKRTTERVEREVKEAAKIEANEAAKKAAKEIVYRMLRNEEPIEKIVQYVPGLSEEEIRELAVGVMQPA